jgi:predicted chitinase
MAGDIVNIQMLGDQTLVCRMNNGTTETLYRAPNGWWLSGTVGVGYEAPTVPGDGEYSGVTITAEMIRVGNRAYGAIESQMLQTPEQVAKGFNDAIAATYPGILSNKKRAACFVGECLQETGGFRLVKEQGADNARYAPYVGRGWIQLTWKEAYLRFGKWLKSFGLISDENMFVNTPTELENLKWAPYTAIWEFHEQGPWSGKNLFEWCDTASSPWSTISRAINRGHPTASKPAHAEDLRAKVIDAVLLVTPEPVTATPDSFNDRAGPITVTLGNATFKACGCVGQWITEVSAAAVKKGLISSSIHVTKGGYLPYDDNSKDTHTKGGTLDLRMRSYNQALDLFMREAGCAGWYRDQTDSSKFSPHYHLGLIGCSHRPQSMIRQEKAYRAGLSGLASGTVDRGPRPSAIRDWKAGLVWVRRQVA